MAFKSPTKKKKKEKNIQEPRENIMLNICGHLCPSEPSATTPVIPGLWGRD